MELKNRRTVRSKFASSIRLIRPANSIMVGFAVIVGIGVASHNIVQIFSPVALLGFLTGFAISSFSMISNDIYDIEVDRVNQPGRPLVIGETSVKTASFLAISYLVIGLLTAGILGFLTFSIAGVFAFIGWFYNYYAKRLGLLGNSLVALSVAIPFIYGSVSISNLILNLTYPLAFTSFLAGLGREVLKGISDIVGDKIRNIKSVAVVHGSVYARRLTSAIFLIAVVSSSIPVILGMLGHSLWVYIILIFIPDAIFLFLSVRVVSMSLDSEAFKLKGIALAGMLAGLLAYLVAGLSY